MDNTPYRRLIEIDPDDPFWDKLPKEVKALPVYYRKTAKGIELWPMWKDIYVSPNVAVYP